MKRTFAIGLLAAASLMAPAGAFAQIRVQATIPFDFTVGQRLMPAGTYVIARLVNNVIQVRGWKGNDVVSAAIMTAPTDENRKSANRLIFNKYGDQYFLSEIHEQLGAGAAKIAASKLEQRIRLERAAVANQAKTEIALKR